MAVQRFSVRVYDDHFLVEKDRGNFVMVEGDTKLGAKLKEMAGMEKPAEAKKVTRKRRTKAEVEAAKPALAAEAQG